MGKLKNYSLITELTSLPVAASEHRNPLFNSSCLKTITVYHQYYDHHYYYYYTVSQNKTSPTISTVT